MMRMVNPVDGRKEWRKCIHLDSIKANGVTEMNVGAATLSSLILLIDVALIKRITNMHLPFSILPITMFARKYFGLCSLFSQEERSLFLSTSFQLYLFSLCVISFLLFSSTSSSIISSTSSSCTIQLFCCTFQPASTLRSFAILQSLYSPFSLSWLRGLYVHSSSALCLLTTTTFLSSHFSNGFPILTLTSTLTMWFCMMLKLRYDSLIVLFTAFFLPPLSQLTLFLLKPLWTLCRPDQPTPPSTFVMLA